MSSKLELHRIRFGKSFLLGLSSIEQRAFLLSGQVMFELNVLNKLRVWSLSDLENQNDLNRQATIVQSEYISRLLGGSVCEAWESIRKILHQKEARHILEALPPSAGESHSRLKKLFGSGTNLSSVRNELAFHYDAGKLQESLEEVVNSDPELMELVFGETVSNNIPAVSMYAALLSISRKYDASDLSKGLEAFDAEVHGILGELLNLTEGVMIVLIERYLGRNWASAAVKETLDNVPFASGIRLPFFSLPE